MRQSLPKKFDCWCLIVIKYFLNNDKLNHILNVLKILCEFDSNLRLQFLQIKEVDMNVTNNLVHTVVTTYARLMAHIFLMDILLMDTFSTNK